VKQTILASITIERRRRFPANEASALAIARKIPARRAKSAASCFRPEFPF